MFRLSVWAIIRCVLQIKLYDVHEGWGGSDGGEISFVLDGVFLMYVNMSCTDNRLLHDLKLIRY